MKGTGEINQFYKLKASINIIFSASLMFFFAVLPLLMIAGCANTPSEIFDGDPDGAYFITDESYKNIDASRPQNVFRCVIAGDKMMLAGRENHVYDIYDITPAGDASFRGNSITGTVSFQFEGNTLCMDQGGQTIKFKKDKTYIRSESESIALAAPQNVKASCGGEGLNFVMFQWDYRSDYGNFGAAVEIKTANSREFTPIEVERVYMNMFTVQLDSSNFETGENQIRIYHIGGPDITNDHSIKVHESSNYVTYCVTVDESGKVTVKQ